MIQAIIVDDEIQGRKLLRTLIEKYCPQIEIINESSDLPNAVKAIRKFKPQLVFLDIEMPGHSGLEIVDFFNENEMNFSIIFTTAYTEYAIQGYKLSAIDYLLKPIESEELILAVKRYESRVQSLYNTQLVQADNIAIPVGQSIKFFDLKNILYFKAVNSYTEIHFIDQTKILVSRTLKNFEEALSNHTFFKRCHKSYIVNKHYVLDYVKSDGGFLILKSNIEIPISSDKVPEFLNGTIIIKR